MTFTIYFNQFLGDSLIGFFLDNISLNDIISLISAFPLVGYVFYKVKEYRKHRKRVKKIEERNLLFEYTEWIGLDHWSVESVDERSNEGYDPFEFYVDKITNESFFESYEDVLALSKFGKAQLEDINIENLEKKVLAKYNVKTPDEPKVATISAITRLRSRNTEISGLRIRVFPLEQEVKNLIVDLAEEAKRRGSLFIENGEPENLEELVPFFPIIRDIQFFYFAEDEDDNIYCLKDKNGLGYLKKTSVADKYFSSDGNVEYLHDEVGLDNYQAHGQDVIFNNKSFILGFVFKLTTTKKNVQKVIGRYNSSTSFKLESILKKEIGTEELSEDFRLSINTQLVKQKKLIGYG
ncbi:hypothetical protein [Flagellimonas myxillae]|uniref:hypothetical protein n=1 Tax=Flagellimonas myxillae TaxID=2942214 RepID=UPI00201F5CB6|nr:hypothetical protein [Muricauda myxillae]MCL6264926.1 hypothetical protein [Muricauda myxillae]